MNCEREPQFKSSFAGYFNLLFATGSCKENVLSRLFQLQSNYFYSADCLAFVELCKADLVLSVRAHVAV